MKRGINKLEHIVSTNIKTYQVKDVIDNELKFDSSNGLDNNPLMYPLPVVTISLRVGKIYIQIRDNITVSRDYDSSCSYISYLSAQEGENILKRGINKLEHIVSTNIKTYQVKDVIDNELKFDSSNGLDNNPLMYPLPVVTISLRVGKSYIQNLNSGLICLWYSGYTGSIINSMHINPYKSKLRANKAN